MTSAGVDKTTNLRLYETMVRIRRFEEVVIEQFARGKIPGFLHSYLGQEASATGVCAHLRDDDYITSTHRGHGHILAKGARTDLAMAELYGRSTGYCNGKGGSMHIADPDIGVLGAIGIVGAGLVIANGAAFSAQYRGTDQVAVCFFGDGASNTGTFHEGMNMAALWQLPVVFVCENNCYAESTPQCDHQNIVDVAVRAQGYDMPSDIVDGNDVLAVYESAGRAVERARSGGGPTFLETKTYRIRGHYEGDPQNYRSREEVDQWRELCAIRRFRTKLIEDGMREGELDAVDAEIEAEMEAAMAFAEQSPHPDVDSVLHGIYTEGTELA